MAEQGERGQKGRRGGKEATEERNEIREGTSQVAHLWTGLWAQVALLPHHLPPAHPTAETERSTNTDLLLVLTPDPQQLGAVLLLKACQLRLELQLQPPLQVLELGLLLPAQLPHLVLKPPLQLFLLLL